MTIRCLYVATCQENEEKSDFWKKILQWRWYNTCNISYVASFLEWDIGGNYVEMISIAFLWCKNIQGIEWYASHDHTMPQFTYKSPKGWKSGFFFNFWCVFGVIFDHPENFEEFFFASKKNRGKLVQNLNPRVWAKCYRCSFKKTKHHTHVTSTTEYPSPWITTA